MRQYGNIEYIVCTLIYFYLFVQNLAKLDILSTHTLAEQQNIFAHPLSKMVFTYGRTSGKCFNIESDFKIH